MNTRLYLYNRKKNRKEKWLSIQTELLFYCVNIIRCERWKKIFYVCKYGVFFYRKRNIVWHVAFEVRKLENWHWENTFIEYICFGLVCLRFYLFFFSSFVATRLLQYRLCVCVYVYSSKRHYLILMD